MNSGAPGGAAQRDLLTSLAPCDSGTRPPLRSGSRFQVPGLTKATRCHWCISATVVWLLLEVLLFHFFMPSARCSRLLSLTLHVPLGLFFFLPKLSPGLIQLQHQQTVSCISSLWEIDQFRKKTKQETEHFSSSSRGDRRTLIPSSRKSGGLTALVVLVLFCFKLKCQNPPPPPPKEQKAPNNPFYDSVFFFFF